jgi:hypothetical protein
MNEGKKFCADCSQIAVFEDTSWMATRGISRDRTPLSSLGPHASLSSQHCSIVLLSSRRSAPRLCYRRQLMMDARAAHVSSTRSDGASSAPPRSPLLLAPPTFGYAKLHLCISVPPPPQPLLSSVDDEAIRQKDDCGGGAS